jgi:hypothetical protein
LGVNTANNIVDNNRAIGSEILLHELQLGEQLNESVHQARRADFSLMLAMLCDDVREHSQFILPQADNSDVGKDNQTDKALRKYFDLPDKALLALKNIEQVSQYNQRQLLSDNNLISLQLSDVLSPKPLAFRDDKKFIASNVLGNTSLTCQEKNYHQHPSAILNKRIAMKVDNWLKAVQMSLVKSSLVDGITA